jgi:hypothetical protein
MSSSTDNTQHSLTAPADRVKNPESTSYNLGAAPLTETDVRNAMKELHVTSFTDKFPRLEKAFSDPPIPNQTYSLVSFTPAKGATPDKDGVFGMVKVRGTFATEDEAMLKAEYLIRNVDSYHSIFNTYVGRPFPLSVNSKYVNDTTEIDIRRKTTEEVSQNVRKKRDEEKQTMREIEDRQKELIADVEKKEEDPYDVYTELMVKKAQLTWTYKETLKKMDEMKASILKTRDEVTKMRSENDDYHNKYMDKYLDARKKAGLPMDDNSFIKYMAEDLDLGF